MAAAVHSFRYRVVSALAFVALVAPALLGQAPPERTALAAYDQILDTRVRDGFVYYRALKADRAGLDRFVASLAQADLPSEKNARIAFWLNAYNALVLRTVVDHYPIQTRTTQFPAHSLPQIPGGFSRKFMVAGQGVSIDQIEQAILPAFHDPRVFLAIGRGAVGSGRLRGELYTAEALEQQLKEQVAECASRDRCIRVDPRLNRLLASQIFQWRRKEFAEPYVGNTTGRSPIERAVIAVAGQRSLDAERTTLARDRFTVQYLPFDWSLNDLATRRR